MSQRPLLTATTAALSVLALALGAGVGHLVSPSTGAFGAPLFPTEAQNSELEGKAALAIANMVWLMGTPQDVNVASNVALSRLPKAESEHRARLLMRMALLVESPDGQGALFHAACQESEAQCDRLQEIAGAQAAARAVAPGNRLPVSMIPGHPPLGD